MFGFFKKAKPTANPQSEHRGDIYRYDLDDWWVKVFTLKEREWLAETYRPLGMVGRPLVEGNAPRQPELDRCAYLANLASWASKPGHMSTALKIADKARFDWAATSNTGKPMQRHLAASMLCKVYYRWRDDHPGALEHAIWACRQSIESSVSVNPDWGEGTYGHYCYKQLAIIEEKRGNLDEAIRLSEEAKSAGWRGDWDKRLARLEKKVARQK